MLDLEKITILMKAKNWEQLDLYHHLKSNKTSPGSTVSKKTIDRVLSGKSKNPQKKTIVAFANALEVSLEEITLQPSIYQRNILNEVSDSIHEINRDKIQQLLDERNMSLRQLYEKLLLFSQNAARENGQNILAKGSAALSYKTLQRIMSGKTKNPTQATRVALAEFFNVSSDELEITLTLNAPSSNDIYDGFCEVRSMSNHDFLSFENMEKGDTYYEGYDGTFLRNWRKAFHAGCIGFYLADRFVGGMGIWPLTELAVKNLIGGKFSCEEEILPEYISQAHGAAAWYLGGILLDKKYRLNNDKLFIVMFLECFDHWLKFYASQNPEPLIIYTTPVRRSIRRSLLGMGFPIVRKEFDNGEPLFELKFETLKKCLLWREEMIEERLLERC
ncbi:helix-turn-helix protein [Gimesia maris]|uniref:helix-turn-helix domain-containing protein n=1 Tax=Gimesia maris TaxID=122 RepID=UPI00118A541F|nr:helix-turn-helix transcriptional regulator [Gimesia maris]QDT76656.1 helix-turn-helix protein [Gimesia maris]